MRPEPNHARGMLESVLDLFRHHFHDVRAQMPGWLDHAGNLCMVMRMGIRKSGESTCFSMIVGQSGFRIAPGELISGLNPFGSGQATAALDKEQAVDLLALRFW